MGMRSSFRIWGNGENHETVFRSKHRPKSDDALNTISVMDDQIYNNGSLPGCKVT